MAFLSGLTGALLSSMRFTIKRKPVSAFAAVNLFITPILLLTVLSYPRELPAAEEPSHETEREPAGALVNELFVGENIYVQDKGEWVLSLTPSYAKASDAKEIEIEPEIKYGLTDRIQLSAELPYTIVNPDEGSQHQGVGDLTLAANYNFVQSEMYSLGVRAEFTLPTGDEDRDLGGGQFAVTPWLLSAFRVGPGEVLAGIGEQIGEDDDAFLYDIAGAVPFKSFVGILELTGSHGGGEDAVYLTPGAYYRPSEKFQVGLGVPIGLTDDADDFAIVGKLILEF